MKYSPTDVSLRDILFSPLKTFGLLMGLPYLLASWGFSRRLASIEPAQVRQSLYLTMVLMTAMGVAALVSLANLALGLQWPAGAASFAALYSLVVFHSFFRFARPRIAFLTACWNGAQKAVASK